jgi:thiamine biosynthesis protein ThiS
MEITLNGESRSLPSRITLREMLRDMGLDEGAVAVERNREIVRRDQWTGTLVQAGDRIEIVHFVGGG